MTFRLICDTLMTSCNRKEGNTIEELLENGGFFFI